MCLVTHWVEIWPRCWASILIGLLIKAPALCSHSLANHRCRLDHLFCSPTTHRYLDLCCHNLVNHRYHLVHLCCSPTTPHYLDLCAHNPTTNRHPDTSVSIARPVIAATWTVFSAARLPVNKRRDLRSRSQPIIAAPWTSGPTACLLIASRCPDICSWIV